jgi:hypothetical protein
MDGDTLALPLILGLTLADLEILAEPEIDGLTDALLLIDGDTEADLDNDADCEIEGETEADREIEGETEAEGEIDGETDALGLRLADVEIETDILTAPPAV